MEILLVILAFVLLAAGILGVILPILPGPTLSFAGLLVLRFSGYGKFSTVFLVIWALIAIFVTVMDYILPSIMTKRFGGSRAASIGAFLGLLVGVFFFAPWGLIIGPFLGALAGELIFQRSTCAKALKAALGAFLAFIVGSGIKLTACSLMLYFAIRALIGI